MSEKLHGALVDNGSYTKSYDEFVNQFSTEEAQDKLYNALNKSGDYTKSSQEFKNQFFPIIEEQQKAEIPENVIETEQQEIEQQETKAPNKDIKVASIPFEGETLPYEILPEVKVGPPSESSRIESFYINENESKEDFYIRTMPKKEEVVEQVYSPQDKQMIPKKGENISIENITKGMFGAYTNASGEPATEEEILRYNELEQLHSIRNQALKITSRSAGDYSDMSFEDIVEQGKQKKVEKVDETQLGVIDEKLDYELKDNLEYNQNELLDGYEAFVIKTNAPLIASQEKEQKELYEYKYKLFSEKYKPEIDQKLIQIEKDILSSYDSKLKKAKSQEEFDAIKEQMNKEFQSIASTQITDYYNNLFDSEMEVDEDLNALTLSHQNIFKDLYSTQWGQYVKNFKPKNTHFTNTALDEIGERLDKEFNFQYKNGPEKKMLLQRALDGYIRKMGITDNEIIEAKNEYWSYFYKKLAFDPSSVNEDGTPTYSQWAFKDMATVALEEAKKRLSEETKNYKDILKTSPRGEGQYTVTAREQALDANPELRRILDFSQRVLDNPEEMSSNGFINFWKGLTSLKGHEYIPVLGGLIDLNDSFYFYKTAKKKQDGKKLSKMEDLALTMYSIKNASDQKVSELGNTAYNGGKIGGGSFSFMGEVMLTSGLYTSIKNGIQKVVKETLDKRINKLVASQIDDIMAKTATTGRFKGGTVTSIKEQAKKQINYKIKETISKPISFVFASAAQTSVMPQRWLKGTFDNMTPEIAFAYTDQADGLIADLELNALVGSEDNPDLKDGDNVLKAFFKAFGTTWAEYATERMGELLPGLAKGVSKKVGLTSPEFLKRMSIGLVMRKMGFSTAAEATDWMKKTAGYHGVFGELTEEFINMPISNLINGETWHEGFDEQSLKEMTVGIAPTVLAFSSGNVVYNNMTGKSNPAYWVDFQKHETKEAALAHLNRLKKDGRLNKDTDIEIRNDFIAFDQVSLLLESEGLSNEIIKDNGSNVSEGSIVASEIEIMDEIDDPNQRKNLEDNSDKIKEKQDAINSLEEFARTKRGATEKDKEETSKKITALQKEISDLKAAIEVIKSPVRDAIIKRKKTAAYQKGVDNLKSIYAKGNRGKNKDGSEILIEATSIEQVEALTRTEILRQSGLRQEGNKYFDLKTNQEYKITSADNKLIEKQIKEATTSHGSFTFDQKTGKKQIVINKVAALEGGGANVAGHEFLHHFLSETLAKNPELKFALGKSLENYIYNLDARQIRDSGFRNRVLTYQQDQGTVKAMEETLNILSDAIANGTYKYNESAMTKLGDIIRRIMSSFGVAVEFGDGRDVFNFIRDYNKAFESGKLSSGLIKTMEEGAVVTGETAALGKKFKEEVEAAGMTVEFLEKAGISFSKEASDKVQQIYEEQGVAGAFKIINEFKPITTRLARKYRNVPGYEEQLLIDEIETGKRGIFDLIREYKLDSGVPLAAYINKFLPARAIEASKRVLGEEFMQDVTERVDIAAEEVAPEVTKRKPKEIVLADRLGITKKVAEAINKIVPNLNIDKLTFKTLKNEIPEITGELFGISTKKIENLANLTKGELQAAQMFINKNADLLIAMLPEGATAGGTATGVPNSLLKAFYTKKGRAKMAKTGSKAGLTIQQKNNIKKTDFLETFGIIDGKPVRTDRNTSARVLALANLTGKMITNQAVRQKLGEADAKVINAINRIKDGKSSIMFSKNAINEALQKTKLKPVSNKNNNDRVIFTFFIENEMPKYIPIPRLKSGAFRLPADTYGPSSKITPGFYITKDQRKVSAINAANTQLRNKRVFTKEQINKVTKTYSQVNFTDNQENINSRKKGADIFIKGLNETINGKDGSLQNLRPAGMIISGSANATYHIIRMMAPGFGVSSVGKLKTKEHVLTASDFGNILFNSLVKNNIDLVSPWLLDNYYQINVNERQGALIDDAGFKESMPEVFYENLNKAINAKDMSLASDPLIRYTISNVPLNEINWHDGGTALTYIDKKYGFGGSLSYGNNSETSIKQINDTLTDFFAKKITKNQAKKRIESIAKIKFSKKINSSKTLNKALIKARTMSYSKEAKGITVLDFDDTLATTKSLVKFTRPDGTTGTLNAEEYASTYENLLDQGFTFDFSEFNKVVKGKLAPLFNKAMKLQGKFGPENMFVLTARPPAAQKAIFDFLKANGLNIPIKNITGLGNSTAEAKALWMADKVADGYNDFYFADDALQNVQAVDNVLSQFNVKRKIQQAKVKFSKGALSTKQDLNWKEDNIGYMTTNFDVDGNNYKITLYPTDLNDTNYELEFDLVTEKGLTQEMTGTGNQFKVLGIVYNGLLDVVKQKPNIETIGFSALTKDKSRARVYTILMDKLGKKLGWKTDIYEYGSGTQLDFEVAKPKTRKARTKTTESIRNIPAVKNILNQSDVKSPIQQAKIKFSKDASAEFNNILEETTGIESQKQFSDQQARLRGAKTKYKSIIPASAQDFQGLLYSFLGKGKKGEADMAFFKKALIDPFARGINELNSRKQSAANDFRNLNKAFKNVKKKLNKKITNSDYTHDQAIRVYLWNKAGFEIPGLSKRDLKILDTFVKENSELQAYADAIGLISKKDNGYSAPKNYWLAENIASDLLSDGAIGDVRSEHLAEWIENKNIIFSPENLNKIEAIYGSKFREALEDILYRMETGRNRPMGGSRLVNAYLNWVNNSVGAIMFLNLRSATLQTISAANYMNWNDNNPLKAGMAFANQKQFWSDFVYIFNSDFLKQRRSGNQRGINEAEISDAVAGSDNKAKAAIAWLLKKGFTPTQIADSFAISMGGSTFYRNRIKTYVKQGMTQKEAEAKAFLDFQEITEVNQQSARPDMISQQQASPLGRLILAFQNTPMQYARIMNKATRDLYNGRGDAKTHVSKIVYYGVVQSIIFGALQSALYASLGDDEEEVFDKKKERILNQMVDSWLSGIGVGGKAIGTMKNSIMEYLKQRDRGFRADHAYTMLQLLGFSPPIGSKLRKIYTGIKEEQWSRDVFFRRGFTLDNPIWSAIGNVIEGITNAPLGRISNLMLQLDNAMDANHKTWQRIALLLGQNTWDLGIQDPDIEALKIEIKEEKKLERAKERQRKKAEKEEEKRQERDAIIEKNKEKSKEDGICAAVSVSGNRCKNKAIKNGLCTIHEKTEQRKDGKQTQCKKVKSNGNRCKMKTTNKSGLCYYHD